ncbi:Hydrolase (HAD superfamily) [Euzebya pacifica]|jgi:pimeloyl-ACP methyl ester carboxylesterase|uniref:Hydrolase (HAD superfamily) n=1 Tax=Euzebya pacifica TaxID=1608957 RepID=A0A346Y1W7_9ACTN|nr:alpha/beta fold hydrolase [Euzebya pacifica]AXV08464.1 Hydrolase (HAD superfamily) [Euzebya pacifica]
MFIELNGVRHHYVSKGEGPPVVLVHGLGGDLHAWYGVIECLAVHHHVIALDLRGHGRSDAGSGGYSIQMWAQDVNALIAALELPPVTLVGHSLGSLVAQQAALDKPEAVDQLVLVGGISWFEPDTKKAYNDRADLVEAEGMDAVVDSWLPGAMAPRTQAKLPQLVGLARDMYLRNDPQSYAKSCRALAKMPRIPREDIGQPTLLVVGDHDRSTPIAMTEELHAEIPVSRVRVIPTAAHWVMLEQPDALSAAILEYLT